MTESATVASSKGSDVGHRAVLGLASGDTALATDDPKDIEEVPSGGIIFLKDMPAIEEVLDRMDVITAVIEKPAPDVSLGHEHRVKRERGRGVAWSDMFVLAGLPTAIAVAGALLLVAAVTTTPIVPNPYIAFFVLATGIVLGATSMLAWRDARRG